MKWNKYLKLIEEKAIEYRDKGNVKGLLGIMESILIHNKCLPEKDKYGCDSYSDEHFKKYKLDELFDKISNFHTIASQIYEKKCMENNTNLLKALFIKEPKS